MTGKNNGSAGSPIIVDPNEPIPLQPRGESGPTYFLRPPTVADRARYSRALGEAGARQWRNLDLMRLAKSALDRLLPGEEGDGARDAIAIYVDRLTAALERYRDEGSGEETDAELLAAVSVPPHLIDLLTELAENDTGLRRAAADNAVYALEAGQAAAKLFLVGWEGEDLPPFKRGLSGPTEATLAKITNRDFEAIGRHIEPLVDPPEARLGNSASRSSQPSEEKASSSAGKTTRRKTHSEEETASA